MIDIPVLKFRPLVKVYPYYFCSMKHSILFFFAIVITGIFSTCAENTQNQSAPEISEAISSGLPSVQKLTQAIEQDPNNAQLYAERGALFYELENYDEGIADLSKAIGLDSSQAQYYHLLADIYLDYYRSKQALNTLQLAANKFPKRIPTLLKLAEFQWILKQYNDALFTLERIRVIDPLNSEMFFMFGNVFKDMGRKDEAINAYQSCVENDPENIDAWIELGRLIAEKKLPAAERYFDNALRVDSNNVAALHAKAYYLSNQKNDLNAALKLYKKINTIDPQYVDGYYNAGLLYLDMDSIAQAYKSFDIAVKMAPTFAEGYYHRGVAAELMGNTSQAVKDYENVLRFDPEFQGAKAGLERLKKAR